MKRLFVGGIVGGIVLFFWGFLSHAVLTLGETGINRLPDEEKVIGLLGESVKEGGLYIFPGVDHSAPPEQQEAALERYRKGPSGFLVFHPGGGEAMSPRQFAVQITSDIVVALIAAWILLQMTPGGFGRRLFVVVCLGLLVEAAIGIPYWNWYGFPTDFTMGSIVDQLIGFSLLGTVLAGICRPAAVVISSP